MNYYFVFYFLQFITKHVKQLITIYSPEFVGLTGVLKKISGILGLSFWELLMSLPHVCWNLSDCILYFCAKISGLNMWLVYPITTSFFLTHSIHRNYHFTNPTTSHTHTDIYIYIHLTICTNVSKVDNVTRVFLHWRYSQAYHFGTKVDCVIKAVFYCHDSRVWYLKIYSLKS